MRETNTLDHASSVLARRALLVMLSIGAVSSSAGLLASTMGMVGRLEFILLACVFLFNLCALVTLLAFRKVPLQTVATATTGYYAAHMSAGVWISLYGTGEHLNLFIYLLWFFPLLVFNKLVNQPGTSRFLGRILVVVPLLTVVCLLPRWTAVLLPEQRVLLGIYCLTYTCYAIMLTIVTRYREKYIIEQHRARSLKLTAEVFESISDCFISLDADLRLVYLNDAACNEFKIRREAGLHNTLAHAAPNFLSSSILSGLHKAALRSGATLFEAQSQDRNVWYDLRCFPRADGLSIYFRDITSRKASEARIEYLAFYDVLTGLPNRQLLNDRLALALTTDIAQDSVGALLYLDLDDFKTLNDTWGHEVGDIFIKQIALRVGKCLPPGHTMARIGGDDFGILLEDLGPDSQLATARATVVAETILQIFRSPLVVDIGFCEMRVSIGATLFVGTSDPKAAETVDDLLKRADLALYRAKANGGNALCFFDSALQADVDNRAKLRADLFRALQNNEFLLHYQPQVDSEGIIRGSEALLRWIHPTRGNIPPSEFIPLAEEAGIIIDLGRWVLQAACEQLYLWASIPSTRDLSVAVNVSIRQFLDPNFVDLVRDALRFSGANPRRLKLEITESSIMEKVDEVIAIMSELKTLGISFSLDDFGTGYSSLSHLRHLPFDQLKIDRSFVANVLIDEKDASIARTIIVLGRSLSLSVIAEGVETEAQRDFLMSEGCHLYQGYLFSPAVTASKFAAFVANTNRDRNRNHKFA